MADRRQRLGMSAGALRAVVLLFVMTFALAGTSWYHTNSTANGLRASVSAQAASSRKLAMSLRRETQIARRLRREVLSECAFNGDLGGVPVTNNPATGRPSLLGLRIVSDSRVAWHQAGCPGHLVRPSPSFAKWARFYHLPTS